MHKFKAEVNKAIQKATGKTAELSYSKGFGDVSSRIAFQMKGNAVENAAAISKKIKPSGLIKEVLAQGPYLNFFVDRSKLSKQTITQILKEREEYGSGKRKKESIMIEYSQPNTHKAFHIGHLRSTSIGNSLVRINKLAGSLVIGVNYQGDTGAHVAKVLWAMERFHKGETPPHNKGKWLAQIYAEATDKLKDDEIGEKEVQQVFHKLFFEADPYWTALWEKTRQWSIDEFTRIYQDLDVTFDRYFFESQMEKKAVVLSKKLLKKKIAIMDEGALLVDLEKYNLGKFLLLRSDKTPLYSSKDLALAEEKFKQFKIDKSIIVTGSEQKFYFQQLFKTLELDGFKKEMIHIPFELVNLPSGKMKSREGTAISFEDLEREAVHRVKKLIEEKNPDLKDKNKAAKAIALGALKYWMLRTSSNKTIVFEWDKALDFNGETGPYIQYAFVRSNSLLGKSKRKPVAGKVDAHALVLELSKFGEVVEHAAKTNSPSDIAHYAYRVADEFNKFYEKTRVIGHKNEPALLALVEATGVVLENSLYLLGIKALKKM